MLFGKKKKSIDVQSDPEMKRREQIERLESEKENAVIRAENEKKTEEEILRIKESYDYKIRALK